MLRLNGEVLDATKKIDEYKFYKQRQIEIVDADNQTPLSPAMR